MYNVTTLSGMNNVNHIKRKIKNAHEIIIQKDSFKSF